MLRQIGDLIRRQQYAQSFAAIRLVGGLVAGAVLVGVFLLSGRYADLRWFLPLFLLLTAVNLVAVWQSSRRRIDRWMVPLALFDTAAIAILMYITGGAAGPLELLFLFPIGQVAIGASVWSPLLVAAVAAAAYTGLRLAPLGGGGLGRILVPLAASPRFDIVLSIAIFFTFAVAAGQAGQALRSQERRLLDRSSRLRRELGTLARLARTTARETELAPILGVVLETAGLELGIPRSAVLLGDVEGEGLRVVASRGFSGAAPSAAPVLSTIEHSLLVDSVIRQGRTLTAQRRYRRQRSGGQIDHVHLPGAAAAPLLVGGACLGCLYVDAGTQAYPWTDEGLLLLEAFADLTAVSVDNARLYNGLLAEKSKLAATMGAVSDALLIYEPGGRVLLANPPFRTLFEVSPQATDLTVAGLSAYLAEQWRLDRTPGSPEDTDIFSPSQAELEIGIPSRQLQRRGQVVRDEAGAPVATVLTFHDVTEEHQAERVRSEILATVSHELRTPLTSIKGFMQIFDRRQRRGECMASEHELHLVLTQVEQLMALVDDLLDVSHLPGRHMRLTRSHVDLVELGRERIARLCGETERSIDFACEARFVTGQWDRRKLAQVLDNLLDNAVKYSDPGSAVRVTVRNAPGKVELTVQDAGVGVASEHLGEIFEAFFRVDNTTTRRTNGLGIGLYLCKRIVEAHGGDVFVRSEPGIGSEFGFSLPLSTEEPLAVERASGVVARSLD